MTSYSEVNNHLSDGTLFLLHASISSRLVADSLSTRLCGGQGVYIRWGGFTVGLVGLKVSIATDMKIP
jgi:hypothetical protein